MSESVLSATGLTRRFRSGSAELQVLRGVDLTVSAGEIVGIVGPSGSGKSTLLHCLGGLDRPSAGTATIDGTDLWELPDEDLARLRNRRVGFVFQFHYLLPDFSALENVMLPMLIAGADDASADRTARERLAEVGLADRADHTPGQLSGGEQQRVAVARALANGPAVILADEPSGNLDVAASLVLHDLLSRLREERGATFVIATHDPELARRADRVLALCDGVLVPTDREDPKSWVAPPREVAS